MSLTRRGWGSSHLENVRTVHDAVTVVVCLDMEVVDSLSHVPLSSEYHGLHASPSYDVFCVTYLEETREALRVRHSRIPQHSTSALDGFYDLSDVFDHGKVKIEFSAVSDRCFLPDQKILFLAEVIGF